MTSSISNLLTRILRTIREIAGEPGRLDDELAQRQAAIARDMPGNPASVGYKVYSQTDEDGIIARLFEVLGDGSRTFIEIGCSDGLENNTHAMLLRGWRGAWIDADGRKIHSIKAQVPDATRLQVRQSYVTSGNASQLVADALAAVSSTALDFLSVDIDGDDLGVLQAIIDGPVKPRVVCVEYNAKFPPPMDIAVDASLAGHWTGDDYQGASLSAICRVMHARGYRLVACNCSGVNAFLVRDTEAAQFPEFPVEKIYQPARYRLRRLTSGHPPSLKFLADQLRR